MSWYQVYALCGAYFLVAILFYFLQKRLDFKKFQQENHIQLSEQAFQEKIIKEKFIRESEFWQNKIIIVDENHALQDFLGAFNNEKKIQSHVDKAVFIAENKKKGKK